MTERKKHHIAHLSPGKTEQHAISSSLFGFVASCWLIIMWPEKVQRQQAEVIKSKGGREKEKQCLNPGPCAHYACALLLSCIPSPIFLLLLVFYDLNILEESWSGYPVEYPQIWVLLVFFSYLEWRYF